MASQRDVTLQFAAGAKRAKLLQLAGTYTAQMIAPPEELGTLTDILKAAGQSAHGKDGGTLKLNAIEKLANGDYQLEMSLETPLDPHMTAGMVMRNGMIQMRQIQIQVGIAASGNVLNAGLPHLLDEKGNKWAVASVPLGALTSLTALAPRK